MLKAFLFFCLTWSLSETSFGYPQFIGKGYHACLTCHYNPFGNGPLNDYGRGVAATGLAGRFLIPDSVSDDTLGESSSIFFGKPDKLPIKPSLDYRGIYIQTGLADKEQADPKWINMQAEVSASANWGQRQQYVVNVSYNTLIANNPIAGGSAALNQKTPDQDIQYIREAYVGYRVTNEFGVYLGKTDKVYGVRIADHNLINRSSTRNSYNNQATGAMFHYGTENYDAGFMIYNEEKATLDNEKTNALARNGFSGKFEYSLNKRWRVGITHLNETEDETNNKFDASAFIFKTRVGEGSSLIGEVGQTNTNNQGQNQITSQYIYLQSHMYMKRGLYFVTTYEQETANVDTYDEVHRFGPGIQWFPLQRFEFRFDLFNAKTYSSNTTDNDKWEFQGQVHLWF